jgi:hypothetical protein
MKTLFRFALVLMLAGCSIADHRGSGPDPELVQKPIIGGEETDGDPAVVAVTAHRPGESQSHLCTGTLIAPTWVLTAASCLDPRIAGAGLEYTVVFHPQVRGAPSETRWPVKRVVWNTAFDPNNLSAGNDIGLLELANPAPSHISPIPYLKSTLPGSHQGGTIRLVGYGLSNGFDSSGESAGIKRTVEVTLNTIGPETLAVGTFGQTSCAGDSGGPGMVKIDGEETVVGVSSYGFIFCLTEAHYTRVDRHTDWIAEYVDEPACTPQCQGKSCGPDGCGGICGTCSDDSTCSLDGQCVARPNPGCPEEAEPNETPADANALCAGGSILGSISTSTDEDWFVFTIPRKTTYTVLVDNVSANYAVTLYAKTTKTGNLMTVGEAKLAGRVLVISGQTQTAGAYYARVRGVAGHSSADQYGVYLVTH